MYLHFILCQNAVYGFPLSRNYVVKYNRYKEGERKDDDSFHSVDFLLKTKL